MFNNNENNQTINTITGMVSDLIQKYEELKYENELLHNEIVTLKAQDEAKTNQIFRLEDELSRKNIESEDVMEKIKAVLGK
ncbi:hypothetical protein [Campylobacter sp. 19-13652]|uniref:hypothetical protein n=1 Tax=Campylobacter sp. 19-13652 TaxID=2840180 RepID=UPI001C754AA2|nr:hypothetical protein [Campylobacter sp. 19-13652]BCX79516.1 hypothetical protein LBC_09780 [Campylobacter sp. 19-13652]